MALGEGEKAEFDAMTIPQLEARLQEAIDLNQLSQIKLYLYQRLYELKDAQRQKEREEDLEIQRALISGAKRANCIAIIATIAALASAIAAIVAAASK